MTSLPPILHIRNPDIDFKHMKEEMSQDLAFQEYFLNSMSLFIPNFEKFVVQTLIKARPHLAEEESEKVRLFIKQEGNHLIYHTRLNDIILERYQALNGKFKILEFEFSNLKNSLMESAAFEHLFAVNSELLLKYMRTYKRLFHSKGLLELWMWHSVEEIEHRSIAFDAARTLGTSYLTQMNIMSSCVLRFYGSIHYNALLMLRHDQKLANQELWIQARQFYKNNKEAVLPRLLSFFHLKFHPNQKTEKVEMYLDKFKREFGY